jgi:hypothetical protein
LENGQQLFHMADHVVGKWVIALNTVFVEPAGGHAGSFGADDVFVV